MKLKLFEDIPGLKLHEKFKFLKNTPMYEDEKTILSEWGKSFYDRDNKIVKEFQTTFDSSFWELYLSEVLRKNNFKINTKYSRPDFMISEPLEFNIEAVVTRIKNSGKKEAQRELKNTLSMFCIPQKQEDFNYILDEAITRYSNSISSKNAKCKKNYEKLDWFKKNIPFVVALGSFSQIDYGREFIYPLIALLYGEYYNPKDNSYIKKEFICKPNTNAKIDLGLFGKNDYENISAIMFSCTLSIGKLAALSKSKNKSKYKHIANIRLKNNKYEITKTNRNNPEYLEEGLFIYHNPNAKNKLPKEIFEGMNITQISYDNNKLSFNNSNSIFFSRYNTCFYNNAKTQKERMCYKRLLGSRLDQHFDDLLKKISNNYQSDEPLDPILEEICYNYRRNTLQL